MLFILIFKPRFHAPRFRVRVTKFRLSVPAIMCKLLSDISKLSFFLTNTKKKFWLINDNHKKMILLPNKKNIDLTVNNDFLLTYQIKNMTLPLSIQSICKKSRHSSLLPRIWLYWKKLHYWFAIKVTLLPIKGIACLHSYKIIILIDFMNSKTAHPKSPQ